MSQAGSKRQLSLHEKIEAVQRVHDGESKAGVARRLGIPESTLRGWCKNKDKLNSMIVNPVDSAETSANGSSDPKRPKEGFPYCSNPSSNKSWFWRWYKHYGFHNPDEPLPLVKEKCTLDTILLSLNSNNVQEEVKENAINPPESAAEALQHGEKFLRWLECCSDPSVTAIQLRQFRFLLNNVRSSVERKMNKTKLLPHHSRK